jgi:hypothetical protein
MAILRDKVNVSFRLSKAAKRQVEALTNRMGLSQTAVVETAIRQLAKVEMIEGNEHLSASELMKRPIEERRAALRKSAILLESHYNDDLAKPPAERELTAFTALNGEPFLDNYLNEEPHDHGT